MTVYHISSKFLGKQPKFQPRIPQSRMQDEDDTTPRICVAERIEDCYVAYLGSGNSFCSRIPKMHVYATNGNSSVPATSVPDYKYTKERWLLEAAHMEYIGEIPAITMQPSQCESTYRRKLRETVRFASHCYLNH